MSKSTETYSKKEREKKKNQKRNEKAQRKEERKHDSRDGQDLNAMMGYVDEFGRLTDTPPTEVKKATVKLEDIVLGATIRIEESPEDRIRTGVVSFFNDAKGFGFIRDIKSGESVFVHINSATFPIKENDKVTFEIVSGQKGPAADQVNKA